MNRVPVASEGDGTTAPGRGGIPGCAGAGPAEGRDAGGASRCAGSRGGAPAQPERTRIPAANRGRSLHHSFGGAGVTIFAICMNGVSRSIGTGKMVVELFSAATSRSVWR